MFVLERPAYKKAATYGHDSYMTKNILYSHFKCEAAAAGKP